MLTCRTSANNVYSRASPSFLETKVMPRKTFPSAGAPKTAVFRPNHDRWNEAFAVDLLPIASLHNLHIMHIMHIMHIINHNFRSRNPFSPAGPHCNAPNHTKQAVSIHLNYPAQAQTHRAHIQHARTNRPQKQKSNKKSTTSKKENERRPPHVNLIKRL